ncbi:hypothetical protein [Solimonas terrae]|uniref:Uncharacterized protein n=1 Tax=Solimonas terrae TaxID=1396819 RepID=A0A6M2BNC1_9GAMM|nr:hypothetical protein [Solimonas terrae]NGY03820.1 hypothetical protein [Solimonas terrae]
MNDARSASADADPKSAWHVVMSQPRFPAAARRLAANMLQACDEDQRFCAVSKDAGHYVAAMSAAYLHGAGGLTLARLKTICAASGFLSAGRARSLLQFLVHLGYLQASQAQGRALSYLPTALFLAAWQRHLQLALLAAAVLEPSLQSLCDGLDQPPIFAAFLGIQATRLYTLTQSPDPVPGLREAFLHPRAGTQILWLLAVAGEHDQPFPTAAPVRLKLSRIAARFHVTHVHVRRVLQHAESLGLLEYDGHGSAQLSGIGRDTIRLHFAFQLAELAASGADTLRALAGVAQTRASRDA